MSIAIEKVRIMSGKPKCFEDALRFIDEANSQDPNTEKFEGKDYPKELLYSMRMTKWLETIEPHASEALRLAVRSQHICRWEIPRSDYPPGSERGITNGGPVFTTIMGRKRPKFSKRWVTMRKQ